MRQYDELLGEYSLALSSSLALKARRMEQTVLILTAITTILVAIVGPWVSWKVAKYQTDSAAKLAHAEADANHKLARKQMIAPMRQAWIDKLRDRVASFVGVAVRFSQTVGGGSAGGDEKAKAAAGMQRLIRLGCQIQMMLNTTKPDHVELVDKLSALSGAALGLKSVEEVQERVNDVIAICRKIFKGVWEEVKHGDLESNSL